MDAQLLTDGTKDGNDRRAGGDSVLQISIGIVAYSLCAYSTNSAKQKIPSKKKVRSFEMRTGAGAACSMWYEGGDAEAA